MAISDRWSFIWLGRNIFLSSIELSLNYRSGSVNYRWSSSVNYRIFGQLSKIVRSTIEGLWITEYMFIIFWIWSVPETEPLWEWQKRIKVSCNLFDSWKKHRVETTWGRNLWKEYTLRASKITQPRMFRWYGRFLYGHPQFLFGIDGRGLFGSPAPSARCHIHGYHENWCAS